jgi:hypothetical protein
MKRIMLTLSLSLFITSVFACIPPLTVQKTFSQKFPQATNVEWSRENKQEWVAAFLIKDTQVEANFASDGTWLTTETITTTTAKPKKPKATKWVIIEPYNSITA